MARGPCRFRQRDVTAAMKAVKAAGVEAARAEIHLDGRIVGAIGSPEIDDFDRELADFDLVYWIFFQ